MDKLDKYEELLGASEEKWLKLMELGIARAFKTGEVIFTQGQSGNFLYSITSGVVKNVIYLANGKEKIFHFLIAPSFTGQSGLFDRKGHICTAVAVSDVGCVAIPRDVFVEFLFENPHVMYRICCDLVQKSRCVQAQAEDVYNTVPHKLARFLLDVCDYGIISLYQQPPINYTHDEIANLLGTTRQRVTQYLNKFEKEGLVQKSYGRIKVLDSHGLQTYLST